MQVVAACSAGKHASTSLGVDGFFDEL